MIIYSSIIFIFTSGLIFLSCIALLIILSKNPMQVYPPYVFFRLLSIFCLIFSLYFGYRSFLEIGTQIYGGGFDYTTLSDYTFQAGAFFFSLISFSIYQCF